MALESVVVYWRRWWKLTVLNSFSATFRFWVGPYAHV